MLYVQLDVNWADHPKVMAVGLAGAGLHAMAMCMAKRMETDGVLHRAHLHRLGGDDTLIDQLVNEGLLDRLDDARVRLHGWLDRNPSQAAIAATRTAKAAIGREGNHRRWGHPGPVDSCPKCNPAEPPTERLNGQTPSSSQVATPSDRSSDSGSSPCDKSESPETETETETETTENDPSNPSRALALVPDRVSPPATARSDVETVFEAWVDASGRSGRTRLDDKRRRIIRTALKSYPVDDLVDAVQGWRHSEFHAGRNESRRTYNDLGLLLRDSEHIERFRDLQRYGPERVNGTRPRSFDAIARVLSEHPT